MYLYGASEIVACNFRLKLPAPTINSQLEFILQRTLSHSSEEQLVRVSEKQDNPAELIGSWTTEIGPSVDQAG